MKPIVKAALAVAKKYPVFPTIKKMPCWSNSELGVGKGEGGYKIATQDPVINPNLVLGTHQKLFKNYFLIQGPLKWQSRWANLLA